MDNTPKLQPTRQGSNGADLVYFGKIEHLENLKVLTRK
jgi:hypothetical protein